MSAQADQRGGRIEQILARLRRLEDGILVLLLMTMIGVAASQVILRNFFDAGLYWIFFLNTLYSKIEYFSWNVEALSTQMPALEEFV